MADPVIPAPAQPPHPVLANGTFGLMSGEKPMHQAGVDATHENLTAELRRLGLHFEETHGRYEQPERSVIVHAPTRDQMFALGKRFGQDSVVYSRGGQHELLYTNGPHEGKSRLVAPGAPAIEHFPEAPPDYYTHLPGRGYFRINFDWDRDPQHQGPAPAGLAKAEVLTPRPAAHPHGYPWHEGHTDHHQQVRSLAAIHAAFGLAKADDLYYQQNAAAGVSSYARFAGPYGQVLGQQNPSSLRFYPYENKGPEIDDLVRRSGYRVYYAGGAYGKPDLAAKNYNTGHLMIYDPGTANSFEDRRYTDSWRKIHELAHALTYPELNSIYGEGRRIGKLGTHRTPNEAARAVHWEWLAAHKQRELGQQIGVHVPDEVFHRELNTVMHDAVHRAVTGQFTEPGAEGFVPHPHKVPLAHALDAVRDEAQRMGIQHPHGLAPKKGMAKAWPRNEMENVDPRSAANVAFDNMLDRGNAPIPYQPTYTGPAGVHEHTETTGLLDYDPASDTYVRATGPGKPAAHVAGGPYVTEGDAVRAVLPPDVAPSEPAGQRTVAAMREAARANAAKLRPRDMSPLSHRPTTTGELHGRPLVTPEDYSGARGAEGLSPKDLENAYWGDVDAAPTTAAMKWKKYGGKHPIDAIREQKETREAKLRTLFGKADPLRSPATEGVAPAEDTSFDFGANVAPEDPKASTAAGRLAITRMREPRRGMAQAFLRYVDGQDQARPEITPDLERHLARYGIVDPAGYAFDEAGRSMHRRIPGKRRQGRGEEPRDLNRFRLMNQGRDPGYVKGEILPFPGNPAPAVDRGQDAGVRELYPLPDCPQCIGIAHDALQSGAIAQATGSPNAARFMAQRHPVSRNAQTYRAADQQSRIQAHRTLATLLHAKHSFHRKSEDPMEKNLPGSGLKSPAAAGVAPVKPQLHNDLRSFHAALKQHAPGSPGHQALLAAHAAHTPLLQDLGKYGAAGSKIVTAMNAAANAKANAGPQAGIKVTAKAEPPVILPEQGNLMPPVETLYTPAEAAAILKKAAETKIKALETQLQDLRKRELGKAAGKLPDGSGFATATVGKNLVPPHKHNTGTTAGVGTEDVAPAKLNPPGKDDPWKKQDLLEGEPMEDTPGEETSGEKSPADVLDEAMVKEELCKECGSLHKAGGCGVAKNAVMGYGSKPPMPAGGAPGPMMRAELTDPKGKTVTTGEQPSATMPDDGSKHVNKPGSSGKEAGSGGVVRAHRSLKAIKKAALQMSKAGATPPMAKPPSGANMATKVPASKPGGMGKEEMAGSPAASSGGTLSGADGAPGGLGKASMTSQMMGGGASKLTSPADTSRADTHAAALGGAFQPKGPVSSGLELDRPKAGGLKSPAAAGVAPKKLGVMGKDEKSPFANKPGVGAPGTSKVPAMGGSVPSGVQITQPIPTRKPAAGGMHSVGSATPSDALTTPDTQVSGTAMFGPHGTPALPGVGGRRPENTVSMTAPSKKPGIFGRLGKSMKSAKK